MSTTKKIAENITIDKERHDIWIDGVRLPWHVADRPSITASTGKHEVVNIGVLCESARVLNSIDDDLLGIQTLGQSQLHEALTDFFASQIRKRALSGMFAYMNVDALADSLDQRIAASTDGVTRWVRR